MQLKGSTSQKEYVTILAVCFGSLLEWYEVFLYVYWAPLISKLFFGADTEAMNLLHSLFIFMVGFWARPLGGIIFGRIGDLLCRKHSLILSIVIMIFPTLGMGLLPTYGQIGVLAPICFAILRFLQALPSGGELPGAFCYLYEYAPPGRKCYMTSWGAVGSQIGIAISLIESKWIEYIFPTADLLEWGWRLSFIIGSFIALLGFFLRTKLHETPLYQQMEQRHEKLKTSIFQIIRRYRRSIGMGIALCLFTASGFYILCVTFPIYISSIFNIGQNSLITGLAILLLGPIFFPFFGFLGDRFNNKKILIASTITMILLLYPLYFTTAHSYKTAAAILLFVFILCLSALLALMPYRFVVLFPTPVRFTGVGISFNIVDGVLGSSITMIAFYFMNKYHSLLPCYLILFICSIVSLIALFFVNERKALKS